MKRCFSHEIENEIDSRMKALQSSLSRFLNHYSLTHSLRSREYLVISIIPYPKRTLSTHRCRVSRECCVECFTILLRNNARLNYFQYQWVKILFSFTLLLFSLWSNRAKSGMNTHFLVFRVHFDLDMRCRWNALSCKSFSRLWNAEKKCVCNSNTKKCATFAFTFNQQQSDQPDDDRRVNTWDTVLHVILFQYYFIIVPSGLGYCTSFRSSFVVRLLQSSVFVSYVVYFAWSSWLSRCFSTP